MACASLIGANVLLWTMIPSLYMADFIYINPTPATLRKLTAEPAYRRRTIWFRKMVTAFSALTWTAIYGVKLCYLLFFHLLVVRITRYLLIWKCIFVTTVILFVFCICCDYIGCPYFNIQVCKLLPWVKSSPWSLVNHLIPRDSKMLAKPRAVKKSCRRRGPNFHGHCNRHSQWVVSCPPSAAADEWLTIQSS